MYKKIKQQIANQTRPNIGFVKVNDVRGYRFIKVPKTQKTTKPKDDEVIVIPNFSWHKNLYIKDRTTREKTRTGKTTRFYYSVPVINTETYGNLFPIYQLGRDYYNISEGITSVSIDSIDGGDTGSFIDQKIFQDSNITYSIALAGGDGYVVLGIESNDVSFSVWARNSGENTATFISGSENMGLNGLTNISIPVSENGTSIIVLVYAHDPDLPESDDQLRIQTDKYFKINTDFGTLLSQPPGDLSPDREYITWDDPALTSEADPETWRLRNTLNFVRDADQYWKGVEIYRAKHYEETVDNNLSNSEFYDNVVLDTADDSNYKIGSVANLTSYGRLWYWPSDKIESVRIAYKNYHANGGFDYDGGNPDSAVAWYKISTSDGTVGDYAHSSYPYYGDRMFGDRCWKLDTLATDTTKSCGIYSTSHSGNYLHLDTSSTKISFYVKHISGEETGAVKLKFYKSNGDLCDTDSAKIDIHSGYTHWGAYNGWGRFFASVSSFGYPADCDRCHLYLYSCYESTSASIYLFDGVHIGTADSKYIFAPTSRLSGSNPLPEENDRVVIQLKNDYEKPVTNNTNFALAFDDNYDAYRPDITPEMGEDTAYGSMRYLDSANSDWAKFGRGILIDDSATNLISNSRFDNGATDWTTALGASLETISGATLFSDTGYARWEGSSAGPFCYQNFDIINDGSVNRYTAAIWAKSRYARQQVKILYAFLDTDDNVAKSSATFDLSSDWEKLTFSSAFAANGSYSSFALCSLFDDNIFSIDIAGIQIEENKNYISGHNEGSRFHGGLTYSTTGSMCSDFGTIRFWYTPMMNHMESRDSSDSYNYRGLFYMEDGSGNYKSIYYDPNVNRYYLRQKQGANYYYSSVSPSKRYRYLGMYYPHHIVATWNTADAILYVDRGKSNISDNQSIDCSNFSIGWNSPHRSSPYPALGIISNVRIDAYTWSYDDVVTDYAADQLSFLPDDLIEVENSTYIGEKIADKYHFSYVDEINLDRGYKYSYNFRCFDENGNYSPFSEDFYGEVYSWTPRPGYEYTIENKIANSGFEVVNYFTDFPLYWTKSDGSPSINTTYYYTGDNSVGFSYNDAIESEYVYLNTSASMWFSFYTRGGENKFDVEVDYYNDRWELIDEVNYTNFSDYETEESNADGGTWYRPYVYLSGDMADSSLCKYAKFKFISKYNGSYLDCIQVEQDELRDWRESTIIGPDEVDGNMIAFDSLQGRHLYAGELIVSGHSSDANRIIVGRENDYGGRFIEITPTQISFNRNTDVDTNIAYINSTAFYLGYRTENERFFKATPSGIEIGKYGTNTSMAYFTSSALYIGKTINSDTSFVKLSPTEIIMGEESSEEIFLSITKNAFRYHQTGMSTSEGWYFSKQIQSGYGTFGETKSYIRYTDANGSPVEPHAIVTPRTILTYSTVDGSTGPQKLQISYEATASGIYANAYLVESGENPSTSEAFSSFSYDGDGSKNTSNYYLYSALFCGNGDNDVYREASGTDNTESTMVLTHTSKTNIGAVTFHAEGGNITDYLVDLSCWVKFYCTSQSISSNPDYTQWEYLGIKNMPVAPLGSNEYGPDLGNFVLNISNEAFSRAKTIGLHFYLDVNEWPSGSNFVYYMLRDFEVSYTYGDDTNILKQGSDVGSFNYTVFDGGSF